MENTNNTNDISQLDAEIEEELKQQDSTTYRSKVTQFVYSPDIQVFDFDNKKISFNILASCVVSPFRILLRVTHNIPLLTVEQQSAYSVSLSLISGAFSLVGLYSRIVYGHSMLFLASVLTLCYSFYLRYKCSTVKDLVIKKHEIKIDKSQIESLCNSLADDLERI